MTEEAFSAVLKDQGILQQLGWVLWHECCLLLRVPIGNMLRPWTAVCAGRCAEGCSVPPGSVARTAGQLKSLPLFFLFLVESDRSAAWSKTQATSF